MAIRDPEDVQAEIQARTAITRWENNKDTVLETIKIMVEVQKRYYDELIAGGFTEQQAILIISSFHPLKQQAQK